VHPAAAGVRRHDGRGQIPSLPYACPRSARPRCGGREWKLLSVSASQRRKGEGGTSARRSPNSSNREETAARFRPRRATSFERPSCFASAKRSPHAMCRSQRSAHTTFLGACPQKGRDGKPRLCSEARREHDPFREWPRRGSGAFSIVACAPTCAATINSRSSRSNNSSGCVARSPRKSRGATDERNHRRRLDAFPRLARSRIHGFARRSKASRRAKAPHGSRDIKTAAAGQAHRCAHRNLDEVRVFQHSQPGGLDPATEDERCRRSSPRRGGHRAAAEGVGGRRHTPHAQRRIRTRFSLPSHPQTVAVSSSRRSPRSSILRRTNSAPALAQIAKPRRPSPRLHREYKGTTPAMRWSGRCPMTMRSRAWLLAGAEIVRPSIIATPAAAGLSFPR